MIRRENLETLLELLGAEGVEEHAPISVDGVAATVTLRPADGESLARTLAELGRCGLAALVRGGGNRWHFGNPPRRGDVILSTERLTGVDVFEPGEGVCHARAGTTLAQLRSVVNPHGWDVPLDPPGAGTTLGGALAAAAVGPRAQGFGAPRAAVLGLEVAFSTGERTRCGGRVVKNVTGFDLAKLYTGSFGTLAVIEGAWLRLRPRPQRTRCFEARSGCLASACRDTLAASRRGSARAGALVAAAGGRGTEEREFRIAVELAGDGPGVDRDAAWLETELGAVEASSDCLDRVREHQGALAANGGLRFRIAALPSRFEALLAPLHAEGAETLAYPALRLVYAGFPQPSAGDEGAVNRAFGCVSAAVAEAGGSLVCEAAPTWAKAGREMYGEVAGLLPLFEALKTRFDPGGVLNPGRFAGRL